MPIRASNTEPNDDLTSSDNPDSIISSPLLDDTIFDEWTIILLRLAFVSKSLKKKFDGRITKRSTTRYSAIHNLLDRLCWLLGEEVIIRREDRLSLLPESLLCHILSSLTTKEAVCTSVLSSGWTGLWKWIPRLDLESSNFPNDESCVDFINNFLLNLKSLSGFKLSINRDDVDFEKDASLYEPCLAKLIKRKIQHFQVENDRDLQLPLTLPVCEALVSLKLCNVKLNDFESLSLPCLKIMHLKDYVIFSDNAVLDTPRLEHLTLTDYQIKRSFKIISMSDSVKVYIDVEFEQPMDDDLERNIIYNLLNNFSAVGDMTLSQNTLEIIYLLKYMDPLPKFRDLTRLHATMYIEGSLELLPYVLERCPNLKHLTLELINNDDPDAITESLSNNALVSSLENVEIESPITEEATEVEVVKYFLGNGTKLKKLVLRLNVSDGEKHDLEFLKQRFDSPTRSSLCQFEVQIKVL